MAIEKSCARSFMLSAVAAAAAVVMAGCFGGGSDDEVAAPPAAAAPEVQGTAAVGAALANANVAITNTSGQSVCEQATIVTAATGAYSCTLKASQSAPFIVVVTDPSGGVEPLVSVATTTPAAGQSLVVNATPLTTAIVAQLSPDDSALSVVANPALIDAAKLATIKANVLAQLAAVTAAVGVPAGYDPFSTPIVAATGTVSGNTADQLIDVLKVSTVNGVTTIATIDNPSAGIVVADAATTSPPTLAAPGTGVVTLAAAVKTFATAFEACFALPLDQRVLAKDDTIAPTAGGPEVTQTATACDGQVDSAYLNSGYNGGQAFYGTLNDTSMTGARFSPPVVMNFSPGARHADGFDRALLNMRFIDANGVGGNYIQTARRVPGSASSNSRNSDWWFYGNQQAVDSVVRAYVRRSEQLAPNPGTAPLTNAGASRYETGIEIFVNKDGPGSIGLRAARLTGPGLPSNGIVLTRPAASLLSDQTWLNIRNKSGNTDPAVATPDEASNGNIFRLQRTVGLGGADATTVRPNPNAGNSNNTAFPTWAHPADYGLAPGTTGYINFAQLPALTVFTLELFYDGEATPRFTYQKSMLTPVVPATTGGTQQWLELTAAAKNYLDPANALAAATPTMNLSWVANPYAQTVRSAGVYTFDAGGVVNQGLVGVTRGATTATATGPIAQGATTPTPFPALTADGTSGRTIQLRYRMLDGAYKDSTTRYN